MSKYIVGVTGASGSIYAQRLIEVLLAKDYQIYLVISQPGQQVWSSELGIELGESTQELESNLRSHFKLSKDDQSLLCFDNDNLAAPIASGSFKTAGMMVIPCSMATLAGISSGRASSLLKRAADVCLKEKRQLIVVPRETPLNVIHLENMLKLARLGVDIIPPMPGFYNQPQTIDDLVNFVVGRVLDRLEVEHNIYQRWQ
ncbi:UbiX family flavin prenyltransferase [Fuchsiella alkaliacetigena]|uniref:UbiX family flavin prenyltransferase n=1 Tax=Fuchsiella alkaliacetigena TaxID=957042 RepID=UPI00200A766C|nr:flavin prenyltransferase UbiX [Fuchsiella alkaliacetigena]MCK8825918.1 UbiX family flavin prenyltransferase [Fuchsiella alkaliacetigena]